METQSIFENKEIRETMKKALRAYHYTLVYQLGATVDNIKEFPHPIDNYLAAEAEKAESLLMELNK